MTPTSTRPRPIFGLLAAGEQTTRKTSRPIPKDHVPVIQNQPGGQVQMVGYSDTAITLENHGDGPAMFSVYFITAAMFDTIHAAKTLFDSVLKLRRKGSPDGNNADNS